MLLVIQHPVLTLAGFVAFRFAHYIDKLICPIHYYLISLETGESVRMEVLLADLVSEQVAVVSVLQLAEQLLSAFCALVPSEHSYQSGSEVRGSECSHLEADKSSMARLSGLSYAPE